MIARTFNITLVLIICLIIVTFFYNTTEANVRNIQEWQNITQRDLLTISNADDKEHLDYLIQNIIRPRVVGTPGHEQVKEFLISEMKSLGMHVKLDSFNSMVPYFGNVTFTNVIGQLNSNAERYLTLACHYDSKYFPNDVHFQGAIDSAVPCAIMLDILKTLQPALKQFQERDDISLMLIFFDGEEAFKEWTAHDSLYGSRHLSKKWNDQSYTLKSTSSRSTPLQIRKIDRIELMILIDLIGGKHPLFYNFFRDTQHLYVRFIRMERRLRQLNLLQGRNVMFLPKNSFSSIDDDHKPFLEKNIPILHLIPIPFPNVWHTPDDNYDHLDFTSINNFNRILRGFTLEYLINH